ncbi:ABC transporter permease [uncultured Mycolicibacterium sp.]|uniref:ABC transporter permease n=1 Tax=uncultured Mycolicibacterium sp. TaxID=2320817 RepID=UPI002605B316|nr:ABC transporter permease [uncultured Mycolicibacterium sp.]
MTAPALVREAVLLAGRQLTGWRRQPVVPIQSMLFPTLLLLTYDLVVARSMARLTGTDALEVVVPTCAVAGAVFGAMSGGFTLPLERDMGLISRLWTFPVHRASALTGIVLAEAVRTLIATAVITAVGVALGLRFPGPAAVVAFLLVPVLVIAVFAPIMVAVALRGDGGGAMFLWLGTATTGLVFANAGLAPVQRLPHWLRPVIEYQPMSAVVATMRALSLGEPVLGPLLLSVGWAVLIGAIGVPVAVRAYRVAAES